MRDILKNFLCMSYIHCINILLIKMIINEYNKKREMFNMQSRSLSSLKM